MRAKVWCRSWRSARPTSRDVDRVESRAKSDGGRSMLKLHGFSASNYYNIAKLALLEKGLPFEEVTVYTGAGPGYRPDYLGWSPLGKVPCLETDEGFLAESRCIVDYVERAAPDPALNPRDGFAHAELRA